MALIGSGTYLDIPNVVGDGKFDADHIDTAFGAVIQQIGGSYWSSGTCVTVPGNLNQTNFASDAGITNNNKAESYSGMVISGYIPTWNLNVGGTVLRRHFVTTLGFPFILDRLAFRSNTQTAVFGKNGPIDLIVNNQKAFSFPVYVAAGWLGYISGFGPNYTKYADPSPSPLILQPGDIIQLENNTGLSLVTISYALIGRTRHVG